MVPKAEKLTEILYTQSVKPFDFRKITLPQSF